MKTKEEWNAIKEEAESLNNKLAELTDEELEQVTGGINWKKFGQLVLDNGGENIPGLAELVSAINSQNWPLVAILGLKLLSAGVPVVVKAWNEA